MQLPDGMIADFQENPPYEFYGSTDYELHVIALEKNGKYDLIVTGAA